jgi:hypothetical protein
MKAYAIFCIFAGLFFYLNSHVLARVVINEFVSDSSPQKIELYNTASDSADISNWYLDDSGGSTYFTLPSITLSSHACVVFESDFNLNKSSPDQVRLFDATYPPTAVEAILQDSFSYKASSGSGIVFMRNPDGEDIWATGEASFGKLNISGQSCLMTPSPSPTPLITPTITLEPTIPPISNSMTLLENIYISEAMVYPETGDHEWVELYNDNEIDVDLVDWYIDDIQSGGSSPKKINIHMAAKRYAIIELSSSMFNNDTDSIRLLNSETIEKDAVEYFSPKQSYSIGRISFEADDFCNQEPSQNNENNPCLIALVPSTVQPTPNQPLLTTNNQKSTSFSPEPSPQKGTILGSATIDNTSEIPSEEAKQPNENNEPLYLGYTQGLSLSAIILSSMNIGLIIFKIKRKIISQSV